MTPALKAMVKAMAAEIAQQVAEQVSAYEAGKWGAAFAHYAPGSLTSPDYQINGAIDLEKVASAGLEAIKGEPFARIVASESLECFAKTGAGEDAGHARWIVEDPVRRARHIDGSWRDYRARAEAMIDAILKDQP